VKKPPRNVEDVDYATADGNRPMREVIRERKAKARSYTRKQLDAAYRARAREVSLLQDCLCCYPIVRLDTPSGHEPWCPTESLRRSFDVVDARANNTNNDTTDTEGTNDGT
jgi:hypothetical protein